MKPSNLASGLCLGFLGAVLLGLPRPGLAQPGMAPASAAASSSAGAAAPISALYASLTQIEHSQSPFAQRAQTLAPVVDQVFDLPTVLRNSLGLRYNTLPDSQKQQLLEQFRQFTVARYVSNFGAGSTDQFKVDPATTASPVPGDQIVHTHILAGGSATEVNYVMRQGATGWRVVDVLLNGTFSQVAVQRADFSSGLTSGDATPLIESLRKKTQAFSQS